MAVVDSHAALASVFWFDDLRSFRIRPSWNPCKMFFDEAHCTSGLEVAHQNKNCVVRNKMLLRVSGHFVPADPLDIGQPAEGLPTIGMPLKRRRSHFVVQ